MCSECWVNKDVLSVELTRCFECWVNKGVLSVDSVWLSGCEGVYKSNASWSIIDVCDQLLIFSLLCTPTLEKQNTG